MGQIRDEILLKKIALKLKKLREGKDVSQEKIYEHTNVHVGRIEANKVNISVSTLSRLCKYYDISLVDFFKKIDS